MAGTKRMINNLSTPYLMWILGEDDEAAEALNPVTLQPGANVIDADFATIWAAQNRDQFVLTSLAVHPDGYVNQGPSVISVPLAPGSSGPSQASLPPIVTPATFTLLTANAVTGLPVGAVHASNSPSSWAIIGGDPLGNFHISPSGLIQLTGSGATALFAASGTLTLTVQASNATGTSTPTPVVIKEMFTAPAFQDGSAVSGLAVNALTANNESSYVTSALTTTLTPDILVLDLFSGSINDHAILSVTGTGPGASGTGFVFSFRGAVEWGGSAQTNRMERWWAPAPSGFSGSLLVTYSGLVSGSMAYCLSAWSGFNNVNFPWDPRPNLPIVSSYSATSPNKLVTGTGLFTLSYADIILASAMAGESGATTPINPGPPLLLASGTNTSVAAGATTLGSVSGTAGSALLSNSSFYETNLLENNVTVKWGISTFCWGVMIDALTSSSGGIGIGPQPPLLLPFSQSIATPLSAGQVVGQMTATNPPNTFTILSASPPPASSWAIGGSGVITVTASGTGTISASGTTTWTVVQSGVMNGSVGGSAVGQVTLASPVTSGNMVVAFGVGFDPSTTDVYTLNDNKGNAYLSPTGVLKNNLGFQSSAWYATNVTNGPTVFTLTSTQSGGPTYALHIAEINPTGIFDQSSQAQFTQSGSGPLATGNSLNPLQGREFVYSGCVAQNTAPAVVSPFAIITQENGADSSTAFTSPNSSGPIAPTWNVGGFVNSTIMSMTFKPTAGAGIYSLTVQAQNSVGSSTNNATIAVLPLVVPTVSPFSATIVTPLTTGMFVGQAQASPAATSWAFVAGTAGGNQAGNFAISAGSGVITVTGSGVTNLTAGTYSPLITATNVNGTSAPVAAVITVAGAIPVITPGFEDVVALPLSTGQLIGGMTATNNPTSWAFVAGTGGGNAAGYWAISGSGVITVTGSGAQVVTNTLTQSQDFRSGWSLTGVPTGGSPYGLCSLSGTASASNLLFQSQTFQTAPWSLTGVPTGGSPFGTCAVTPGAIVAPDGSATGQLLGAGTASNFYRDTQPITGTGAQQYTLSCYFKPQALTRAYLQLDDPGSNGGFVIFNLAAGTIGVAPTTFGTGWTGIGATIVPAGSGWFRGALTLRTSGTAASPTVSSSIGLDNGAGTGAAVQSFAGSGTAGVFVWGSQLELGSGAHTYVPTTTGPGSLTQFAVAPDGSNTAELLTEGTGVNDWRITQATSGSATTTYTLSCYLKKQLRTRAYLQIDDPAANGGYAVFDLSGGTVGLGPTTFGSGWTGVSAAISPAGNNWFRGSVTATSGTTTTISATIGLDAGTGTGVLTQSYAGSGTAGAFVWGAQLETGSGAHGYIPTTTTSQSISQLLAGTYTPLATATNASGTSAPVAATITVLPFNDGFTGRPTGTATLTGISAGFTGVAPQFANFFSLNGYTSRPPWHVAGVDYGVGPNTGTVFKTAPYTSQLPTGVTYSTGNGVVVTTTGLTSITLDSFDFTGVAAATNNVVFLITGTNPCTVNITNCKFLMPSALAPGGSATYFIQCVNPVANMVIKYCDIDGNGALFTTMINPLIAASGGQLVAQYNLFHHIPVGGLLPNTTVGQNTIGFLIQYNAFAHCSYSAGVTNNTATFSITATPGWLNTGLSTVIYNGLSLGATAPDRIILALMTAAQNTGLTGLTLTGTAGLGAQAMTQVVQASGNSAGIWYVANRNDTTASIAMAFSSGAPDVALTVGRLTGSLQTPDATTGAFPLKGLSSGSITVTVPSVTVAPSGIGLMVGYGQDGALPTGPNFTPDNVYASGTGGPFFSQVFFSGHQTASGPWAATYTDDQFETAAAVACTWSPSTIGVPTSFNTVNLIGQANTGVVTGLPGIPVVTSETFTLST